MEKWCKNDYWGLDEFYFTCLTLELQVKNLLGVNTNISFFCCIDELLVGSVTEESSHKNCNKNQPTPRSLMECSLCLLFCVKRSDFTSSFILPCFLKNKSHKTKANNIKKKTKPKTKCYFMKVSPCWVACVTQLGNAQGSVQQMVEVRWAVTLLVPWLVPQGFAKSLVTVGP